MARGWESKAVEEQQSAGLDRRAFQSNPLSHREAEHASLMLQRARIQSLIDNSSNPRYIDQQTKALSFLNEKLNALG